MSVFMEFLIFVLCPFIIVGYIIYHRERVRRQNLVKNGEKHRFKYLDTFYYSSGNGDGTSDFIIYHIISDVETNKIYGMGAGDFGEDVFYFTFGRVEIKTPIENGSIPINFGDEGDFWIEKELEEDYYKKQYVALSNGQMKHINLSNSSELIYEVIPIRGYARFDKK